jgi:hypothetical protein
VIATRLVPVCALWLTTSIGFGCVHTHASAPPSAPQQETQTLLPIVPMHLDAADGSHEIASLRADGSIYVDSVLTARVRGATLVDLHDHVVLEVGSDGSIRAGERRATMELRANGELATSTARIVIQPDLQVARVAIDGHATPLGVRLDNVPPSARRTAALFLLVAIGERMDRAHSGATLDVPASVSGSLEASDTRLADGSVADDYRLELRAGQTVTIVVRGGASTSTPGTNLDMYTILMRDGSEVTHDDDSAGNFNSRIIYTATASGEYVVRITTYGSGLKTGAYQIETFDGAHPDAT